jgi:hypothetical protein
MIVDQANRVSVNYHPLPSGRYVLARTREGRAEYSGRGGRQVYTHILIVEAEKLHQVRYKLFAVYRDALALGHFRYRSVPQPELKPVALSTIYSPRKHDWAALTRELGLHTLEAALTQLAAGQPVVFPYAGDRAALAESLIDRLPPETLLKLSFATSLHPSAVRPYQLNLVAPG